MAPTAACSNPSPDGDLAPTDVALIRRLVAALVAKDRWLAPHADDLVQECCVHWWRQQERYDPERGASRETFLRRVINNRLRDAVRHLRSERQGGRERPLSLDHPIGRDPDAPVLGESISTGADLAAGVITALTVAEVLARLTPRQRALLRGLLAGKSVSELARDLRVHRDTANEERRRIRRLFVDVELEKKFAAGSDKSDADCVEDGWR